MSEEGVKKERVGFWQGMSGVMLLAAGLEALAIGTFADFSRLHSFPGSDWGAPRISVLISGVVASLAGVGLLFSTPFSTSPGTSDHTK